MTVRIKGFVYVRIMFIYDVYYRLRTSRLFHFRYGDKFAVSPMARVLTVVWVLTSLITQSLFVASVTTSLVSQSLDVDFKLYGNKVRQ